MITRELLESGAFLAAFENTPDITWWTRDQIAESLQTTLAQRPDPDAPVWLFAYGSLIWNPTIHIAEQQLATLRGWRRSFCMRLVGGRARSDAPGRMLALDACTPATHPTPQHALPTRGATGIAPHSRTCPAGPTPPFPESTPNLSGTGTESASTRSHRPEPPLPDTEQTRVRHPVTRQAEGSQPTNRPFPDHRFSEHWPTHTTGIALRIDDDELEHELMLVWIREMIGGSYRPRWQDILLADGRIVQAIIFTMDRSNPWFEADATIATVAPLIATASGPLGHNLDYLLDLDRALRQHDIHDPYIHELIEAVRAFSADI